MGEVSCGVEGIGSAGGGVCAAQQGIAGPGAEQRVGHAAVSVIDDGNGLARCRGADVRRKLQPAIAIKDVPAIHIFRQRAATSGFQGGGRRRGPKGKGVGHQRVRCRMGKHRAQISRVGVVGDVTVQPYDRLARSGRIEAGDASHVMRSSRKGLRQHQDNNRHDRAGAGFA